MKEGKTAAHLAAGALVGTLVWLFIWMANAPATPLPGAFWSGWSPLPILLPMAALGAGIAYALRRAVSGTTVGVLVLANAIVGMWLYRTLKGPPVPVPSPIVVADMSPAPLATGGLSDDAKVNDALDILQKTLATPANAAGAGSATRADLGTTKSGALADALSKLRSMPRVAPPAPPDGGGTAPVVPPPGGSDGGAPIGKKPGTTQTPDQGKKGSSFDKDLAKALALGCLVAGENPLACAALGELLGLPGGGEEVMKWYKKALEAPGSVAAALGKDAGDAATEVARRLKSDCANTVDPETCANLVDTIDRGIRDPSVGAEVVRRVTAAGKNPIETAKQIACERAGNGDEQTFRRVLCCLDKAQDKTELREFCSGGNPRLVTTACQELVSNWNVGEATKQLEQIRALVCANRRGK